MPNKLHREDCQQDEASAVYALRAAIFKQAFMDFENASKRSRVYILDKYAKMSEKDRKRELGIAYVLDLKWRHAAEVFEWFHSKDADAWLIDTDLTGADVWRMYVDGSWNRNGIKDKPYKIAQLPTCEEAAQPLPERFADPLDNMATFAAMIAAEIEQARKRKENKQK